MVRVISSYKSAKELAILVCRAWKAKGKLTTDDIIVQHIRESLKTAYRGASLHFYKILSKQCPEALILF